MSEQTNIPERIRIDRTQTDKELLRNICAVLEQQSDWLIEQRMATKDQEIVNKELTELYGSIKGFLTVASWFERIAIFIAKIAAAGSLTWAGIKVIIKFGADK